MFLRCGLEKDPVLLTRHGVRKRMCCDSVYLVHAAVLLLVPKVCCVFVSEQFFAHT